MTLTASSVESVIKSSLDLHNPVVIGQPLNRPNIYISVIKKSSMAVGLNHCKYYFNSHTMYLIGRCRGICQEWQLAVQTLMFIQRL